VVWKILHQGARIIKQGSANPYRWKIPPDEGVREAAERGDLYLKSALAGYLPGMLDVATAYQTGDYKEAYPIIVTQCFVGRFRVTEAHSSD
jgi:hypothetical protein